MSKNYLCIVMSQLSNILYNGSQSDSHSKDDILNNLKSMIEQYNSNVPDNLKVRYVDFRDKNNV